MRILAFIHKDSGAGYHRVITPLIMMKDVDVFVTNNLLDEHFTDKPLDIFMYNRTMPDHHMPKIKELQAKYGFKICVDIDDYWELDESHILYHEYVEADFAAQQVRHLQGADFIFTTHERLAELIRPLNAAVHVLPNAIPKSGQFLIPRQPSPYTRLFWQGSITHREDLELLRVPIGALNKVADKIQMVMGGFVEDNQIWHDMAGVYTTGFMHQYKLIPAKPTASYYTMYAHADISLIPLVNNRFNRMKSNLKVLEAANAMIPAIVSDVHPYKDLPVFYCNKSADWLKHINKLRRSKRMQKEAGQELWEFCEQHYNFYKINNERKQIFEHYTSKIVI